LYFCTSLLAPLGSDTPQAHSQEGGRDGEEEAAFLQRIRQHTSAYVSIRQHTSAYASIRQAQAMERRRLLSVTHTLPTGPADTAPIRNGKNAEVHTMFVTCIRQHTAAYGSIRQHTSAYVSMRQRTAAYVRIRQHTSACWSSPRRSRGQGSPGVQQGRVQS
jgi:hypothetical protein